MTVNQKCASCDKEAAGQMTVSRFYLFTLSTLRFTIGLCADHINTALKEAGLAKK